MVGWGVFGIGEVMVICVTWSFCGSLKSAGFLCGSFKMDNDGV
jgi:hypothetical protein